MIVESHVAAWLISMALVVAAIIDGLQRRVPNWLTFPMALGGLLAAGLAGGVHGLLAALSGLGLGLVLMLPLYAIGGMGAGDVKLWAALGTWTGAMTLIFSWVVGVLIGGVMAIVIMLRSGHFYRHVANCVDICTEVITIRSPAKLAEMADARKPTMTLLPYGIPLVLGSLAYFTYQGLLF